MSGSATTPANENRNGAGMSASSPLKLVLLDIDGTMADSLHNILNAMTMACEACSVPVPPPAHVRRGIGLSLVEAVAQAMPALTAETHIEVAEAYKEAFNILRVRPDHQEPLFPGTLKMLDTLEKDGVLLGVATGKSRRGLETFLERHDLQHRFVTLHTADEGPGKPHPAMIQAALAATGCEAQHTVMVGDATFDMLMARAAGVCGIGVSWGNHTAEALTDAGAVTVIDHFDALPALVQGLG